MTLPPQTKGSAVPSGRLSRLARFGGMATGIAGNMLAGGVAQLARGKRPSVGDLLMTPANALRVTNQLAHLRGAAMKIGQLLSMDGGEFVPPELAEILARLRTDAQPMPRSQVQSVLDLRWASAGPSGSSTSTSRRSPRRRSARSTAPGRAMAVIWRSRSSIPGSGSASTAMSTMSPR